MLVVQIVGKFPTLSIVHLDYRIGLTWLVYTVKIISLD